MFSPTWSTFPLCLCCFLKQIIGSPIIIMYLSLKKTFSLYCGIKARADLLCGRKLAQGILATFSPSTRHGSCMKCTCFQSSFPVCKSPGFPHGVRDISGTFLWPWHFGLLPGDERRRAEGSHHSRPTYCPVSSSATPSSTPPWMTAMSTSAP